ncbi:eukaryotic translation initiation factor 2 subunit 2 [Neocloeon triangulifer]|uniref:eukaryotic translation initiation factor 2 subunit 2 n=1 Tax=Neocloeon triangulifer TaxID=2078957 RepID=UPI00286F8EDF|nr:eukaryotic translation initiation factor 2 subunit 2 [Neocloeon triangulifer]
MSEEDPILSELASKKKKKKKKIPFELDSLEAGAEGSGPSESPSDTPVKADKENKEPEPKADDDALDLELAGKKKRKKKIFDMNKLDAALPEMETNKEGAIESSGPAEEAPADDDFSLDMDFSLTKKKKKKKKDIDEDLEGGKADKADDNENESSNNSTWFGVDRDYTYDELLTRVFCIMHEKNPDMALGKKQKFVMRPPHVVRIGTKKTSFANFTEVCKILHRQPKHLLDFLLAELGTSGSVDGNSQLIIKGRFQQKQIEIVLRRYIKEYVTCHTCRSPNTILQKDTRIFFLQCEDCGSRCSVASIKSGFQAVTGKRAAIRAKTT